MSIISYLLFIYNLYRVGGGPLWLFSGICMRLNKFNCYFDCTICKGYNCRSLSFQISGILYARISHYFFYRLGSKSIVSQNNLHLPYFDYNLTVPMIFWFFFFFVIFCLYHIASLHFASPSNRSFQLLFPFLAFLILFISYFIIITKDIIILTIFISLFIIIFHFIFYFNFLFFPLLLFLLLLVISRVFLNVLFLCQQNVQSVKCLK